MIHRRQRQTARPQRVRQRQPCGTSRNGQRCQCGAGKAFALVALVCIACKGIVQAPIKTGYMACVGRTCQSHEPPRNNRTCRMAMWCKKFSNYGVKSFVCRRYQTEQGSTTITHRPMEAAVLGKHTQNMRYSALNRACHTALSTHTGSGAVPDLRRRRCRGCAHRWPQIEGPPRRALPGSGCPA